MCIGLWPAAPKNLKKWPMANFEFETPGISNEKKQHTLKFIQKYL